MTGTIHLFSIAAEHTTARYFERVVSFLQGQVPTYWDSNPDLRRLESKDILCYVDPASDWPLGLERVPCLTVAYFIDVHQDLQSRLRLSPFFDAVFIAQKDYVPAFLNIGHPHAYWLPLACDPKVHHNPAEDRPFDVGFVGKVGQTWTERHKILTTVLPHYRTNDVQRFYAPHDTARIYGQSKIVFNASINGDLNMRFFEALASGALLVTDRIENGLLDLFEEGVHYVGYSTVNEAIEKIDHYLANRAERERIAAEGQCAAFAHHTYRHRWDEIVRLSAGAYRHAPARGYAHAALGELYSDIFASLRRPSRIAEVVRRYGPSIAVACNLGKAWGRWVNARIPLTPNAIRWRLGAR